MYFSRVIFYYISLYFSSFAQSTAKNSGLIGLLVWMIRNKTLEALYSAEMLDFYHSITAEKNGIFVSNLTDRLCKFLRKNV